MSLERLLRALALVALLTQIGLLIEHRRLEDEQHWVTSAEVELSAFTLADLRLRNELMAARTGLIRHYDGISAAVNASEAGIGRLAALAMRDRALRKPVSSLERKLIARRELVERFKSENALLQNALARFADLGASSGSESARRLSTDVFRLTLDTSSEAVDQARRAMSQHAAGHRDAATAQAAILVKVLPDIDAILKGMESNLVDKDLQIAAAAIRQHQTDLSTRRLRHGWATGLTLSILLACIAALIWRAVERVRLGRRQRRAEQLGAAVAGALVCSEAADVAASFKRALSEIAHYTEAAAAFLGSRREGATLHFWPAEEPAGLRTFQQLLTGPGAIFEPSSSVRFVDSDAPGQRIALVRHHDWPDVVLGISGGPVSQGWCRDDMSVGQAIVGTLARAAHREEIEAERLTLERRLADARRLELVGMIASGVAHNFSNIIGAIAGFAEMAAIRVKRQSATAGHLEEIRQAVGRARTLVDDILGLARNGPQPVSRVSIPALLDETATLLRASGGDRLKLSLDVGAQIEVSGSGARLQQVLMNICNNARDAGRGEAKVKVSASVRDVRSEMTLSHGRIDAGRWCVIGIEDDGPGIPPEIIPRLFEPFFTTRPCGTGLGLSTAWQIVAVHGGTIHVNVPALGGTVFEVWLPAAPLEIRRGGQGERIALLSETDRSEWEEDLLAQAGYEPSHIGSDPADMQAVDGVLAVAPNGTISDVLASFSKLGVPVVAAVEPAEVRAWEGRADEIIELPLRADQLAEVFNQLIARKTADR